MNDHTAIAERGERPSMNDHTAMRDHYLNHFAEYLVRTGWVNPCLGRIDSQEMVANYLRDGGDPDGTAQAE